MDYKQAFFSQLESMYLGVQIEDTQNLFNTDKIQKVAYQFTQNKITIIQEYPRKLGEYA